MLENDLVLNQSFSNDKAMLNLSVQNSSDNLNLNESRQRKVDFNLDTFESI